MSIRGCWPKLSEYAVQAGYARRNYGSLSFDHAGSPTATASGRYGVTDAVTMKRMRRPPAACATLGSAGWCNWGNSGW